MLAACVASLGVVAFTAMNGDAQTCGEGCRGEMSGCIESVRADYGACRVECRDLDGEGDLGSCLRDCRHELRTTRRTCRAERATCRTSCVDAVAAAAPEDATGDVACRGACGAALGECAKNAAGDLPTCIKNCEPGPGRHACVEECRADPSSALADCRATFDVCVADCDGAVTTTTSPPASTSTTTSSSTSTSVVGTSSTTSTTLIPACEEAEAPTCAGTCPLGLRCVDVPSVGCGCFGGSPSPAFLH
jgi:hypothetical protein